MHNLPVSPDWLAAMLRATAKGYPAEAATELLVRHASWLRRRDFLAVCVQHEDDPQTWVWIEWENVTGFLEDAVFSASDARILRLAAELAGSDTGIPLDELLMGLDAHNSALVLAAIAHALPSGPAPDWPQPGQGTEPDGPDGIAAGHHDDPGAAPTGSWPADAPFGIAAKFLSGLPVDDRPAPDHDHGNTGQPKTHRCRDNLDYIGGSYPYECVVCAKRFSPQDPADQDNQD